MSPHQLRHAASARWLRAGVPLLLVFSALGHARPSTTLDHYAWVIALDLELSLPGPAGAGADGGAPRAA